MKAGRRSSSRLRPARATRLARLPGLLRPGGSGQGLVEYALILTLIAIVTIVALIFLGGQLSAVLSIIGSSIDGST